MIQKCSVALPSQDAIESERLDSLVPYLPGWTEDSHLFILDMFENLF